MESPELSVADWTDSQKNELAFWKMQYDQNNLEQRQRNTYYRGVLEDGCTLFSDFFRVYDFAGDTIIDVGSGPEGILHAIDDAARKIAIDPLMDGFREMGYRVDARGVEPVCASAEQCFGVPGPRFRHHPMKGEGVDVVFCLNVLDHTENPVAVMENIRIALRPGGWFLLITDMRKPDELDAYHKLALTEEMIDGWLAERFTGKKQIIPHQAGNPVMQYVFIGQKRGEDDVLYSKLYREGYPPGPTGMLWEFFKRRSIPDGAKVIDAGCGTGVMLRRLAFEGYRVRGIDIAAYAIEQCHGFDAIQGSVAELPWPDNDADVVWCCDVLEHLEREDAKRAIAECARVAPRLVGSVCTRKSGWKGLDTLHKTVDGADWWQAELGKHYSEIHVESPRENWLVVDARREETRMADVTGTIDPPKLEKVNAPVVKLADCCGSAHPYRHVCINDVWYQCVWLPAPTKDDPSNHVCAAWDAVACHNCGRVLTDKTTTRQWHRGEHKPTDDIISALIGQ